MGDVLHALPAVTALRLAHPDWHIGWVIEPHWAPLLPPQVIDTIHLVPTRAWKQRPLSIATLREIATLRRTLRTPPYDIAVDLQGSIRSAVIGRLASVPRFFGPAHPRERQARVLYQIRIPLHRPHVIDQACELLAAGTNTLLEPAAIHLLVTPAAQTWFNQAIHAPEYILLCPTAGWGAKQWPADYYITLAKTLLADGHQVLINTSPALDPISQQIAAQSGAELIPSTVAQLIPLTRHAALVLGGDTGPIHLAAAQQTPVVALFGPTDPARNGPAFSSTQIKILRDPASRLDHRRHAATDPGLLKITPLDVLQVVQTLLRAPVHG